jgi:hypothetical protein
MIDKSAQLQKVKSRFPAFSPPVVECGPGWYQLIIDCDLELGAIDPLYQVLQIKEEFGTLRYYFSTSDGREHLRKKMNEVVAVYEYVSSHKCELCGDMGAKMHKNSYGWMKTVCESCKAEVYGD